MSGLVAAENTLNRVHKTDDGVMTYPARRLPFVVRGFEASRAEDNPDGQSLSPHTGLDDLLCGSLVSERRLASTRRNSEQLTCRG
jgi:hypothetical protein